MLTHSETVRLCQEASMPKGGKPLELDPHVTPMVVSGTPAEVVSKLEAMEELCRTDGRCQYAIDHGAEGLGHCPKGKCAMPGGEPRTFRQIDSEATAEAQSITRPPMLKNQQLAQKEKRDESSTETSRC